MKLLSFCNLEDTQCVLMIMHILLKSLFILSLCLNPLQADDFFTDIFQSSDSQGDRDSATPKIGHEPGQSPLTFRAVPEGLTSIIEGNQPRFHPFHDAPEFVNFVSTRIEDGLITRKDQVQPGTCFGIAYMTHMWFARASRKILNREEPNWIRHYDFNQSFYESTTSKQRGTSQLDGMNHAFMYIFANEEDATNSKLFDNEYIFSNPNEFRMASMARGENQKFIKLGALSHQYDQDIVKRDILGSSGTRVEAKLIPVLKRRIEANGTAMLGWLEFKEEQGVLWNSNKMTGGHEILAYDIQRGQVKDNRDQLHEAYIIHYYDPNLTYEYEAENLHEFDSYLIYFIETQQISLPSYARRRHNLLRNASTFDDGNMKICLTELWEGHSSQQEIARRNYQEAQVGKGRFLPNSLLHELE